MAKTGLEKFRMKVKALQRADPNLSYQRAQQQAKAGKKPIKRKAKKSSTKKRKRMPVKKKKAATKRKKGGVIGSLRKHKTAAKRIVEEQLAWNLLNIEQAKT